MGEIGLGMAFSFFSSAGSAAYKSDKKKRTLSNAAYNPVPKAFRGRVVPGDLVEGRDYGVEPDEMLGIKTHLFPQGRRRILSLSKEVSKQEASGDFSNEDRVLNETGMLPRRGVFYIQRENKLRKTGPDDHYSQYQAYEAGLTKYRTDRSSIYNRNMLLAQNKIASSPGGGTIGNTTSNTTNVRTRKKKLLGGAR